MAEEPRDLIDSLLIERQAARTVSNIQHLTGKFEFYKYPEEKKEHIPTPGFQVGYGCQSIAVADTMLIVTLIDLFNAGHETTATSLRWFYLYMMQYPEVQAKIQMFYALESPNPTLFKLTLVRRYWTYMFRGLESFTLNFTWCLSLFKSLGADSSKRPRTPLGAHQW